MTFIENIKALGWSGVWSKAKIYIYGALIIGAVVFFFWCQDQVESMKKTAYDNGHAAAASQCEAAKASAIIKGTQSRERIDREFKSKTKVEALNFLANTGRVRD